MDNMECILNDLLALFPENDMSEMDASDFKDRASDIMNLVARARTIMEQE